MKIESRKIKSLRMLPILFLCVISVVFLMIEYQMISYQNRQQAYRDAESLIRQTETVLRRHKEELDDQRLRELLADMPTDEGVEILIAEQKSGTVLAANRETDVGQSLTALGITPENLPRMGLCSFVGEMNEKTTYFTIRGSTERLIAVAQERSEVDRGIPGILLSVLFYLVLTTVAAGLVFDHMISRLTKEHKNANTDRLTGLPNRRAYEDELLRLRHNPELEKLTIVSLDLNGLKPANDTRGHEMGDALIKGMAENMIEAFHRYGNMYRTGGDEFMALLVISEQELSWAVELFQKRNALWTQVHNYVLSVSLGSVRASEHPGLDPQELARLADQAMYQDKANYYQMSGHDRRRR